MAGADLEPSTIVDAYRHGAFPMPQAGRLLWWSPVRRGVLEPGSLRVTRSMRRSARRLNVTVDTAFEEVIDACADPSRPGGWIDADIRAAYVELHRLGWAHSVETRDGDGRLVGGVYGLGIGRLFAGESMFHHARDASKVALMALVEQLGDDGLVDVQWQTPHLASLGVVEWPRAEYLAALPALVDAPPRGEPHGGAPCSRGRGECGKAILRLAGRNTHPSSLGASVAISRSDLVAALAEKADTSKTNADAVLSAFSDILIDAVGKGEKVSIPGIVSVERVKRAARTGRNPSTGETIQIPAGFGVKVSAGSRLKSAAK